MRCIGIRVSGEVQGVSFRESAKQVADELGVTGIIRNEPDGSVYVEAEGEEPALEKFVAWCKKGTERAQISKVDVARLPLRDFDGFHVERS